MITKHLTAAAVDKLRQFIISNAEHCVHRSAGQLKHRFVTPSYNVSPGGDDASLVPERSLSGHYLQMYDWDACFFSQAATKAGIDDLAVAVVSNFLSLKDNTGFIPRTVSPNRIWDKGDICKPFLSQALCYQLEANPGKKEFLSTELIEALESHLNYFDRQRRDASGLYRWRNVLESGVDDNLALISPREAAKDEDASVADFPDSRLLACDLNAYLVAELRAFSRLCELSGLPAKKEEFAEKANELSARINALLWNERLSLYCNLDTATGAQVELRSWTGLTPILFDAASEERTEQVVVSNLLAEEHFLRPAGLASMAASESLYNQSKRGLYGRAIVSNWQGPMWILPNVLSARCLIKHGFKRQASEIASRVVATMCGGLESNGTLFENYNAETGKPLWAPQFMSWNSLTLELIDLL